MKIYNGGSYGRLHLMVRPGVVEPENDRWFEMIPGEHGELRRRALTISIQFQDGAAEVDDELGRYLLSGKEQHGVSAEPVPFTRPNTDVPREQWEQVYPSAPRSPPMQVGRPLPPEIARRLERPFGERMRGWNKP